MTPRQRFPRWWARDISTTVLGRTVKVFFLTLAVVLTLQLGAIFIPRLWGWEWHNIGCDAKSWSMCAPGGIMPLSQYWIAKTPAYCPGDIISFDYTGSQDASENGPSVKLVDATAPSYIHVHGMNSINSVPPRWVGIKDVHGKVVAGPFSILPERFWRWLTADWTLVYSEITERQTRVWSWKTLIAAFSTQGRYVNSVMFKTAAIPNQNRTYAVIPDNYSDTFIVMGYEQRPTAITGKFGSWVSGDFLVYFRGDYSKFVLDASHPQVTYVVESTMFVDPLARSLRKRQYKRITPTLVEVHITGTLERRDKEFTLTLDDRKFSIPMMPPVTEAVGMPQR